MGGVLILGATSGIGRAIAHELASQGSHLVLAGRRLGAIEEQARDLAIRHGVKVSASGFDALDFAGHGAWLEARAREVEGGLEGVVLCYGAMEDEDQAIADPLRAHEMIEVNFASPVSILDRAADHLEPKGKGFLCAITSVAGDRGRASNYHYGATKAGLSTYLSGLRARLSRAGVAVVDVRPGMVDTDMTFGRPGLVLLASPERVAKDVVSGIRAGRGVVYTPPIWRLVMWAIRVLPDWLFKRLPL